MYTYLFVYFAYTHHLSRFYRSYSHMKIDQGLGPSLPGRHGALRTRGSRAAHGRPWWFGPGDTGSWPGMDQWIGSPGDLMGFYGGFTGILDGF